MTRTGVPGAILLGGAILTGCLGLGTDIGVSLQKEVAAEGEALDIETHARGGTASVTVTGLIVGELPCDLLSAAVKKNGSTLTLSITLRAKQNVCKGTAPTTLRYIANLVNVPPGMKNLTVRHRFENLDQPSEVVLETVVQVL
ncbi:MAG: hypothetical protein ACE5HQ_09180 [Gemmatimonadota bacterium]